MEWSNGASLRDLLDASPRKRIAPDLGAYIAACVAAGLHAAHELADDEGHPLGVVHRDVSPQNVLISLRGHVRLADFGVAKARGQLHRPTETGEVKGKLSYMAPEQIASKNIDRRADVFALGCVLYEATLGVRPFHGPDAMATMYKILEQAVQLPRGVDPAFPEGLQKVLERALVKDPDLRYQTADDFRAALIEYLGSTKRFIADKHVAELLNEALGEQLRARNQVIVASAEQLRRGETDPANIKSPPPPAPTKTLTPEGGVERTIRDARRAKSARWRVGLGLAASVMALGAATLLVRDRSRELPAAAGASAGSAVPGPAVSVVPAQITSVAPSTEPPPNAPPASPPNAIASAPVRGPRTTRPPVRPPLPTPVSSGAPKTPARAPRPIDQSNPFAKP